MKGPIHRMWSLVAWMAVGALVAGPLGAAFAAGLCELGRRRRSAAFAVPVVLLVGAAVATVTEGPLSDNWGRFVAERPVAHVLGQFAAIAVMWMAVQVARSTVDGPPTAPSTDQAADDEEADSTT